MSKFLTNNFLLQSKTAEKLYHDYAASLPIIDYHCHLPPADIASNRNFKTLTKIWLDGDHYKWRAMRTLGIDENFITGSASDKDKFMKWAETVPYTVRNPLYHWTHMELKNYFGVDELLDSSNAKKIYKHCSSKLQEDDFSTQSLISRMNVETICTTDDPVDSLEYHEQLESQDFSTKVLPAFRSDKAYSFDDVDKYNNYLDELEKVTDTSIDTLRDLLNALEERIDFFHEHGCRLADHGVEKI